MNTEILKKIHGDQLKKRPNVKVGDTVKLHMVIRDGDKSRTQVFEGIVLSIKGGGLDQTITVRKISSGIGVERVVPMHSPTLEKIEVVKRGTVRRSKIYFMRDRIGRAATKIKNNTEVYMTDEVVEEAPAEESSEAAEE